MAGENLIRTLNLLDILCPKKFATIHKNIISTEDMLKFINELDEKDMTIDHERLYNYVIENYKNQVIILSLLHDNMTYNTTKLALEHLKNLGKINIMYYGNKLGFYDFC